MVIYSTSLAAILGENHARDTFPNPHVVPVTTEIASQTFAVFWTIFLLWYKAFPSPQVLTQVISSPSSRLGLLSYKPALPNQIHYMQALQGWILILQASSTEQQFKQTAHVFTRRMGFSELSARNR